MKIAIGLVYLIGIAAATQVRYDGYQVFRVTPRSKFQLESLGMLEELNAGYSFWTSASVLDKPVDVMVPPHLSEDFKDFIDLQSLESEVFIGNVQERIDNEKAIVHSRAFGWTDYYQLPEIYEWLDQLEQQFPNQVSVVVGGQSYEGREVKGVKISFSPGNENNAVFIEGGIHSREWISPAVVTYITNQILTSTDASVRAMAERYDWYIFPVFNPDGYEHTHTRNRMWRKTRVPYSFLCYGADPNRNWGHFWNSGGASNSPCAETYAGPRAFSEPSVDSMSRYISSIQDKLVAYFSFHSYTQLLLLPYGHTAQHLDNYDELLEVGLRGAESLAARYGTQYTVGNIAETIYVATGGSMDWVKGTYGTSITYTYELRDTGAYGFLLPADQIIPSGEETLDSLVTILDEFNRR